jgi:hemoglobin-like flavoprotein
MIEGRAILASLEAVADLHGDPTKRVYQQLFAMHPELEALFHMDRDGGVRASMVQQGLECIIDYVGPRLTSPQVIAALRMHHDGYGAPAGRFDQFFVAMRDAFRDLLGEAWSPDMELGWSKMLAAFSAMR